MDKETIRELKAISKKLDMAIRLLAQQLIDGKGVVEGAPVLRKIGMMPAEIAEVFGTTANTVRVAVSQQKTRKKRGPKAKVKPKTKSGRKSRNS